jgi:hypothetical protein
MRCLKVWDDNGLTSSNSNLNQYLSMLRKTFRHYDIDNIIVTVSRGLLQLNPDLTIERLDASPEPERRPRQKEPDPAAVPEEQTVSSRHARGTCWYLAGGCLLTIALLLVVCSFLGGTSHPITLTQMRHSQCELLASDEMLRPLPEPPTARILMPCASAEAGMQARRTLRLLLWRPAGNQRPGPGIPRPLRDA